MSASTDEDAASRLDIEFELIECSLLPVESLSSSPSGQLPRTAVITSTDSDYSLLLSADASYPLKTAVNVEVKGHDMGREEAEEWKERAMSMMADWDAESE